MTTLRCVRDADRNYFGLRGSGTFTSYSLSPVASPLPLCCGSVCSALSLRQSIARCRAVFMPRILSVASCRQRMPRIPSNASCRTVHALHFSLLPLVEQCMPRILSVASFRPAYASYSVYCFFQNSVCLVFFFIASCTTAYASYSFYCLL